MKKKMLRCTIHVLLLSASSYVTPFAAKLDDVRVIDQNYLMVHILDGEMTRRDDGIGPHAFTNFYHESDAETIISYDPALNTEAAQSTGNWTITSSDDPTYGGSGLHPESCFRKTKLNGHAQRDWSMSKNDFNYEYTYEHTLFLKLPHALQQGKKYTVDINSVVSTDKKSSTITFDVFSSISEAIHINLVGYHPGTIIKSADLYIWMGDGGERSYSAFEGNNVYIYNVVTKQTTRVGTVSFWKKSGDDVGQYNLTRSSVWNTDFSAFNTPGSYRLVIDEVGCSQDFVIADTIYRDPFMVSVQGFFYMRIGQDSIGGIWPVPRRPLFIPEHSPPNTRVYLTTMHPYHAEWTTFSSGDVWDKPGDWVRFRKPGTPTTTRARGGHSDALDWDRHLGHISIIYDMLLPYYLTHGALDDDNCDIAESGNGIPDLLDEARNEVDFWLNLRDGRGYSHGCTNPNDNNELFQAAPTAVAAWASAANAAMLADCFRISGHTDLSSEYRDSAIAAFSFAESLSDKMLDNIQDIGDAKIRGRDLRMTAAAFLYNLSGEQTWEDIVKLESIVTNGSSTLDNNNEKTGRNQVWATAAYLTTHRPVHYPELFTNMKASVIYQAQQKEANYSSSRPSRRSTNSSTWYFRTAQNVDLSMIAHSIANGADKELFWKTMVLEADYGLGRNPLNMIQMTTATTPLENKRSVTSAYTTGGDDGAPGMHPGHTPYMNLDDWHSAMEMGSPSRLYQHCYPVDILSTWPIDEGYFDTRYVWAHNEFTPQQTMRGKMALYGYLYGVGKRTMISKVSDNYHRKQQINQAGSKSLQIRIFDCSGRLVWSGTDVSSVRTLVQTISGANGILLVDYLHNGKHTVYRIIKQ